MARRAVLLLLPLLVAALSGCTVYNDLQRFINRAQGGPEFDPRTLLDTRVDFGPADVPSGLPATVGKTARLNFTAPAGARDLTISLTVTFSTPAPPVAPPVEPPRGDVNITVIPASGPVRVYEFTSDGRAAFSAEQPSAGAWAVLVVARGQGRVDVLATASLPRA